MIKQLKIGFMNLTGLALLILGCFGVYLYTQGRTFTLFQMSCGLACFALAQTLGGSGFIACFVGGILFDFLVEKRKYEVLLRGEAVGDTLALITWVVFGAAVIGEGLDAWTWEVLLYAVLSLTVVRMLPVFLVLAGLQLRTEQKLFMGWFGPRGLATIVFAVIVLNENLPGGETVITTVVCTIILSVIFHGLSANPLVAALVSRLRGGSGK